MGYGKHNDANYSPRYALNGYEDAPSYASRIPTWLCMDRVENCKYWWIRCVLFGEVYIWKKKVILSKEIIVKVISVIRLSKLKLFILNSHFLLDWIFENDFYYKK